MTSPFETLSPTLTRTSLRVPAKGAGTSMVALSLSSVISDCSCSMLSPGATSTSMTSTASKSPMSGTVISFTSAMTSSSGQQRVRLVGVDAVLRDGFAHLARRQRAVVGQCLESRHGDVVAIHLKETPQRLARIRAAVAVGAEHHVATIDVGSDLFGKGSDVVGGRDGRAWAPRKALRDVRGSRLGLRMQQVVALGVDAFALELGERGATPDIGLDAPVLFEQLRCGDDLAQNGARAHELDLELAFATVPEEIHALADALFRTLRHGRVGVVLVHHGDVVEDVLLLLEHPPQAVLHDHRHLVGEGRIVGNAVRDHARENV